jgi:hypothetical protein
MLLDSSDVKNNGKIDKNEAYILVSKAIDRDLNLS